MLIVCQALLISIVQSIERNYMEVFHVHYLMQRLLVVVEEVPRFFRILLDLNIAIIVD